MRERYAADVRRPVLSGRREVAGLWFPADWFAATSRARLILAHWQAGASAYRFAEGDLLVFPAPRQLRCETLEGWPLLRHGRTLCSALLDDDEARPLPLADLWLVRAGRVEALEIRQAHRLDPSTWLDIAPYTLLDTYDCRELLQPATVEYLPPPKDLREILGDRVPPPSPQREEFLRTLQQRPQPSAEPSRKSAAGGFDVAGLAWPWLKWLAIVALVGVAIQLFDFTASSVPAPSAETVAPRETRESTSGWLIPTLALGFIGALTVGILLSSLGRALRAEPVGWNSDGPGQKQARPGRAEPPSIPPRRQGTPQGPQFWRKWLASLAISSQLSRVLSRRQAAYMRRMFELFEKGDLEEALRHAIPLGKGDDSLGQAFGTPGRRQDLSLSRQTGPAAAISFSEDVDDYLRQLYRQSFERLDREGRIDEAVFVLAELLNARQEALDYLEKHQRYAQAADLALAWDMPAGSIVRLHCLAGDWSRALLVARRDNAFASAVNLLQQRWPDVAQRLRLEWAEMLAARGEWLEAVEVIWSLPAQRERAGEWLLHAEAAGGRLAAGALVKRAMLLPDTLRTSADVLIGLRDDAPLFAERHAMAKALVITHGQTKARSADQAKALGLLTRAILGTLLEDHADGRIALDKKDLQVLIALSQDALLQADLPQSALPQPPCVSLEAVSPALRCQAPEAGRHGIVDAVPLHDGRTLVALGEAGVTVLDRDGRVLFRFAVPGHRLVLAQSRQVALALARRDQLWRVSKLDLVNRTATDLGVLAMDFFADEFDGTTWTIGAGQRIRVVDVEREFATVWHVGDLPGPLAALRRSARFEQWLLADGLGGLELWAYTLPDRRLARRLSVASPSAGNLCSLLDPNGGVADVTLRGGEAEGPRSLVLQVDSQTRMLLLPDEPAEDLIVRLVDGWIVLGLPQQDGTQWRLFRRTDCKLCATLDWPAGEVASLRVVGAEWLFFDGGGRLFRLDARDCSNRGLSY